MNLKPNITCAMVLWGGGDISSDRRNVKKTVTLQWVHITVFYEDISWELDSFSFVCLW